MEMDCGVMPGPMPPAGLVAGPPRAADRARWQIVQPAVQRLWAAIEDEFTLDLLAEIPPGEAARCLQLQRRAGILRAGQNGGVLHPAVQEGAVSVVIRTRSGRGRGAEYDRAHPAERAADFLFAAVADALAAL